MVNKNARCKKGMSLIEITVVLAVVAIISVAVVSFTVFVNGRVTSNGKKLAFMQDVTATQTIVENWIGYQLLQGNEILCSNDSLSASTYSVSFTDGTLTATRNTGKTSLLLPSVISLTFEKTSLNGKDLYLCHVIYSIVDGEFNKMVVTIYSPIGQEVA